MGLATFLQLLRRRWRALVAVAVLVLLLAFGYTALQDPKYRSSASVFFSLQNGGTASDLVQGSTYTQSQIASFATLTTTPEVLGPVVEELDLDTTAAALARSVTATAPLDTVIIDISVLDSSADRSAEIANAVAAQLSLVVGALSPVDTQGAATIRATIVSPASPPDSAVTPNIPLNLAAGLLAGLILGLAAALLLEQLDTRVRNSENLAAMTDVPLLGSVSAFASGSSALAMLDKPSGAQAEAYRQIRTNLQFLDIDGAHASSVVVTSALPGEGKSTLAANLAIALAETSTRVLLIDADLRRPALAGMLGIEGGAGLTTVLIGQAEYDDVFQEWGEGSLHVLASGPIPPNPSELLGSAAMSQLLVSLEDRYDVVLLDAAPLLPVTDAAILSRAAVGTIVVANARRVRRGQLLEALRFLGQVDARILGIVLNAASRANERYGYSSYSQDDASPFGEAGPGREPVRRAGPGQAQIDTAPSRRSQVVAEDASSSRAQQSLIERLGNRTTDDKRPAPSVGGASHDTRAASAGSKQRGGVVSPSRTGREAEERRPRPRPRAGPDG